jgi:hypothetical protein
MIVHLRSNKAGRVAYNDIPKGARQDYIRLLGDLNRGMAEMPDQRILYLCRGLVKVSLNDWDSALDDYNYGLRLSGVEPEQPQPEPKRRLFQFGRKPQRVEIPPKDRLEDALRCHRDQMPQQRKNEEFTAARIRPTAIDRMSPDMDYAEMFSGHAITYSVTQPVQPLAVKGSADSEIIRQLESEGWELTGKAVIYDDGANIPDYYFRRPKR